MSYLVLYQVWVCDRDWFRGLSFSLKWSKIQTALKLFERVPKLAWYELGSPGGFLCYHRGRACPIMMSTKRTVELRDRGRYPITSCEHLDPAIPEARMICLAV